MRAYSSNSFRPAKRSRPWRFLVYLALGFVGGFVSATAMSVRQPVELVLSAPSPSVIVNEEASHNASEIWSESGNLSVRTPQPNTVAKSPLVVEGSKRTFEQNAIVRLKDVKGAELAKVEAIGTVQDFSIYSIYRAEITFEKPKIKNGTLEVFQSALKDGSEIDKVIVPVKFE